MKIDEPIDDDVLKLDGSSFLDEKEIAVATEVDEKVESNSPVTREGDISKSLKMKRKKKITVEDDDSELPALNNEDLDNISFSDASVKSDDNDDESGTKGKREKSKRLSKKALEKMHADAQRVLRGQYLRNSVSPFIRLSFF